MLSKYIKNLLDVNSRVIVPDLGAFMLKGDAAKTVYFNEFLRFNDGLLVDYIAEQEQIDKIEAAKKVKTFVDAINKQLSNNKAVTIEGVGSLYLDINEKIQLKVLDEVSPQPSKQLEAERETTPREILFELEKSEPVSAAEPKAEPAQAPEVKKEPKPQAAKATKQPSKENRVVSEEPKKEPVIQKAESIEESPSTTKRMIFVGIFGLVMIAIIVYFAFFRTPAKDNNVNQNIIIGSTSKKDSLKPAQKDSASKPATAKAESKPQPKEQAKPKEAVKKQPEPKVAESKPKATEPKVAPKETPKASAPKNNGDAFYVIAGTFSVESNADRLVKKLKEEGYAPAKIKNEAKNLFYVSYSSFGSKDAAHQEMKKLKTSGKEGVWIYKK